MVAKIFKTSYGWFISYIDPKSDSGYSNIEVRDLESAMDILKGKLEVLEDEPVQT